MISGMKQLASFVCALASLLVLCGFRSPQLQTETAVIQYQPPINPPDSGREGSCWTGSIAAPYRTDAWRCTEGNDIHDPCFSLPNGKFVVCGANPAARNNGFALRLTKPLPNSDTETSSSPANWGWLIELYDGALCSPFTGTRPLIDGEVASYGCNSRKTAQQSLLLGDLDSSKPSWTAKEATVVKSGEGWKLKSSEVIPIKTVWQ